jgi:hypothetical protein
MSTLKQRLLDSGLNHDGLTLAHILLCCDSEAELNYMIKRYGPIAETVKRLIVYATIDEETERWHPSQWQ